ncbi:bifunctional metallophosphatase/5'-nucleotidase [Pseudoduganella plicata]|uniref:Bifunctional metallophosphatase/5'-nucleotidase n=1 Tax=Pseudoduganella plicata TaxID=321984 RepID=A0A4P7BLE7_9BURK|nr:bifunctional metallophosphatase/5'-nucleotidase [Pseudoduganella plicata]QBQ38439.1 bifunctional metallophosphatase/5'-nucleotidase [Pseudoduganella plicata]GGY82097.1 multifunctional 2',3'-cyclic-nucleotide 2'-phosphodiesterase/5'-nucleotidase/3'-nucleotidase [Pseudoduganella plicata]
MKFSPHSLAVAAALIALAGCATRPTEGTTEINLVAINDLHGHLEADKFTYAGVGEKKERTVQAGGIDTLGAALQAWRKEDRELLLVGAGDMIGASPALSAMWADEPTIGALDLLGLQVSSVGNHEFDQGRIELLRQQKGGCASPRAEKACKFDGAWGGAKFDYLAANVIDANTRKPLLPPYRILESKGVKIAFIGAVLKDTAEVVASANIAGLQFGDEAEAVNRLLPELRKQGVGVFVVLLHQGGRTAAEFDKQYCDDLEGDLVPVVRKLDPAIKLVISGHSHKGYLCKVDGKLVTQAQMGGHMLSRIKLVVDRQTNQVVDVSARNVVMEKGAFGSDPRAEAYLAKVRQRGNAELAKPVARIAVPAVTRDAKGGDESALGNLVADATLFGGRPYGAQIAFMNTGGIRATLETGEGNVVSKGQALAVLPFGNTTTVMNLTGAQIRALLEQQWVGDKAETRGLLQVSEGFTYQYDLRKPAGQRVLEASLNGIPLDDNASYRVAANNFLAEGGDAFPMFAKGTNRAETGIRDIDSLNAYLARREQDQKPAGLAPAQPRIVRVR